MVFDPILVASEAVARMQDRRVPIGDPRQLVETPARKCAEAIQVRYQMPVQVRRHIVF